MIQLHALKYKIGSRKKKKIIGRGDSSGHGSYSGRGQKGQKSRSGGGKGLKRLGMRLLVAQTPKLGGFQSLQKTMNVVSTQELGNMFKDGDAVTPRAVELRKTLSNKNRGLKILAKGKLSKKLEVRAHDFSIAARKAITEAGGKAIVIPMGKNR